MVGKISEDNSLSSNELRDAYFAAVIIGEGNVNVKVPAPVLAQYLVNEGYNGPLIVTQQEDISDLQITRATELNTTTGPNTATFSTSPQAGDNLYLVFAHQDTVTIDMPSGWGELLVAPGGGYSITVFHRYADGGEGADTVVTVGGSGNFYGVMVKVRLYERNITSRPRVGVQPFYIDPSGLTKLPIMTMNRSMVRVLVALSNGSGFGGVAKFLPGFDGTPATTDTDDSWANDGGATDGGFFGVSLFSVGDANADFDDNYNGNAVLDRYGVQFALTGATEGTAVLLTVTADRIVQFIND